MRSPARLVFFVLLVVFFSAFGATFFYWYAERSTTILSFIFFLLTVLMGYHFAESVLRNKNKNRIILVSSMILSLLMAESVLRFFVPSLRCYAERNGSHIYSSATNIYLRNCMECTGKDYFLNDANSSQTKNGMEFNYEHKYDKYGLRNDSISEKKDSTEITIVGIGDSFTEGVGAPADSSWIRLLESKYKRTNRHVSAINAGVQGSDLIFSLHLLQDCLLRYRPDIVILDLNSTDINDIVARGGRERFDANGNFHMKAAPTLEYAFGSSFLVRFFMLHYLGYNWQVITNEQQKNEEKRAFMTISEAIAQYQTLSQNNNFKFILVLQPLHYELFEENIFKNLSVSGSIHKIDLYPVFQHKVVGDKEDISTYYWPIDGHFKSRGYEMVAEEIYKADILSK